MTLWTIFSTVVVHLELRALVDFDEQKLLKASNLPPWIPIVFVYNHRLNTFHIELHHPQTEQKVI